MRGGNYMNETGMKVRYIGQDLVGIRTGKIYDVISIERGWYRIMTELDDDYLFPPELFQIVEDTDAKSGTQRN